MGGRGERGNGVDRGMNGNQRQGKSEEKKKKHPKDNSWRRQAKKKKN